MQNLFPASLAALFGLALGSFATLLIWRFHYDEKGIVTGRSRCTKCGKTLGFWNLIPLFSWIFQRGRCAFCRAKISVYYPLTELLFSITFFIFVQKFYSNSGAWFLFASLFFILLLFVSDVRFLEVDKRISFPALLIAFAWAFFRDLPVAEFLLGGVIGFLFYALQYFISRKKWVGAGDMELGALMGLLLGWQMLLPALFAAYILGLLTCLPFLLFGKMNRKTKVPLGAFLLPITLLFLYTENNPFEFLSSFFSLLSF